MKLFEMNRTIYIYIWTAAIVLIFAASLFLLVTYKNKNQTEYLYYTESANVDYKVQLKNNKYFGQDYLEKDNQYIAELTDEINAKFNYGLDIDKNYEYEYKYNVVAKIDIMDKVSNRTIYTSLDELVTEKTSSQKGELQLTEDVIINYNKYNEFAKEFVRVYNLKNCVCKLNIIMDIKLNGIQKEQASTVTLEIPLTAPTFALNYTSKLAEEGKNNIKLETDITKGLALLITAMSLIGLDVLLLIGLVIYSKKTETEEDVYNSELKKILNKYESCISKAQEEFNMSGYKIIKMQSFVDLLEIRDTMRLPIIMLENKEKLMTCFMIPTENNVLYFFSIGVTQYALPVHSEEKESVEVE